MWLILSIASALLSSGSALLEKKVLTKEHALPFVGMLSFFSFLIGIPIFFIFNKDTVPEIMTIAIIAISAIIGGFAFLLVTKSVRHMEISEVSPLMAIGPAVTALLGFVLLGETLTIIQVLGIIIIVIGIYILELKDKSHPLAPFRSVASSKYIHFILIALLLYGLTDVLAKLTLSKHNLSSLSFLFYYQLFLALFYFILMQFNKGKLNNIPALRRKEIIMIASIALLTLAYRYTHISAVGLINIGLAIAVYRSSSLITTIVGGRIYREEGLVRKVVAACSVILGIVLIAM